VFTSTTEFTQRLKSNLEESLEDSKKRKRKEEEKIEHEKKKIKDSTATTTTTTTTTTTNSAPMTSEPLVANSMAAALSLLNRTGELKKKNVIAGRAKDQRYGDLINQDHDFSGDRVKIEYKDSFGRHLTPKEAYRQLSYKFHGIRPGRKKQEKILRKLKEDLQINAMKTGDTPLGMVSAMKRKQKNSRQAGVVLKSSSRGGGGDV
jgi:U4/U6.U5 tri-snRNP-associated protein 1